MEFQPYPLTVKPILKEKVWGGRNLSAYVSIKSKKTGEAWMLADRDENNSVITSGSLKGMTIGKAVEKYPEQIMGPALIKKYGKKFPLLFKYLDTNDRISVQVHPDDSYARRRGFPAGKTEMWYVLANRPGAKILAGFKGRQTRKTFARAVKNGTLADKLKSYRTAKNDCFFIPAGTVHAIGKGNVIFEIQQNSDITYRIYDWGRSDLKGDRGLNIIDAINSVKFGSKGGKVISKEKIIPGKIRVRQLARCGYFYCDEIIIGKNTAYWYDENKALVLTVIEGDISIAADNGKTYSYVKGDLVFFPYSLTGLLISAAKNSRLIITEAK